MYSVWNININYYLKKWLFPHNILSPCHNWVAEHTSAPFTQDLKEKNTTPVKYWKQKIEELLFLPSTDSHLYYMVTN